MSAQIRYKIAVTASPCNCKNSSENHRSTANESIGLKPFSVTSLIQTVQLSTQCVQRSRTEGRSPHASLHGSPPLPCQPTDLQLTEMGAINAQRIQRRNDVAQCRGFDTYLLRVTQPISELVKKLASPFPGNRVACSILAVDQVTDASLNLSHSLRLHPEKIFR